MNVYPITFKAKNGLVINAELVTDVSLPTDFWTVSPALNGTQYTGSPQGNPPAPAWAAIPNYLAQVASVNDNILTKYVTPTSGVTIVLNGALPSGWAFNPGTNAFTYDGTTVNATATSGLSFTATLTSSGLTSTSNTFSVQGAGVVSTDVTPPTIPLAITSSAITQTGFTVGGKAPSDPSNAGVWSGMGQINIKKNGTLLGHATFASLGNQPVFTQADVGPQTSVITQSGPDFTITTTAVDPAYPTTSAIGAKWQQITGTSWTISARIDTFSPANAFDNIRIEARPTLATNSAYAATLCQSLSGGLGFLSEYRPSTAGNATVLQGVANSTAPAWIFLSRNGDVYSFFYSINGNTLVPLGTITQVMGNTLYVGAGINTNDGVSITATIKQVSLQTLADWSFTDNTQSAGTTFTITANSQDTAANLSSDSNGVSITTASSGGGGGGGPGIKWHPGWGMMSNFAMTNDRTGGANGSGAQLFTDLAATSRSVVKHFMGLYLIGTIEPTTKGVYVWNQMDADIASCHNLGVKFWVLLMPNTGNHSGTNYLPQYIVNDPTTYGSSPVGGQGGYWYYPSSTLAVLATWRPAVMDRMIAAAQAIAARYDSNPDFEGISLYETSGMIATGAPDYNNGAILTQYTRWVAATVAAFTTSNVCIQNNYMGSAADTGTLNNFAAANRCGIGGPDVWGASAVAAHGASNAYTWGQASLRGQLDAVFGTSGFTADLRGVMASIQQVEQPELDGSQFTGLGAPFSLVDFFNMASGNLSASHIFITYIAGGGAGDWKTKMYPGMQVNPIVHTAAPSNYASYGINTS